MDVGTFEWMARIEAKLDMIYNLINTAAEETNKSKGGKK